MEDILYDANTDAFISPNHYEPPYQPTAPDQSSQPSHSPFGPKVATEKESRKRSRTEMEGVLAQLGPTIKPKF